MADKGRKGLMKSKVLLLFQYFLYEDTRGIRVGFGTEKSVDHTLAKGFAVGPQRFNSREQAEAARKEWMESSVLIG